MAKVNLLFVVLLLVLIPLVLCENKYSKEKNQPASDHSDHSKYSKDSKDSKDSKKSKESRDYKDSREDKSVDDYKSSKDSKSKDKSKESKDFDDKKYRDKSETKKYVRNEDDDSADETSGFSTKKIKALWQKVEKKLSTEQLSKLMEALKGYDKEELDLKHRKHAGEDKDESLTEKLSAKLDDLLSKFNLTDLFHSDYLDNLKNKSKDQLFQDKKLNKLWKKASKGNFTAEELEKLKQEFTDLQQKITDLGARRKANATDDKDTSDINRFNAVSTGSDDDELLKESEEHTGPLSSTADEIMDAYRRLKNRVSRKHKDDEFVAFHESRVEDLWNQALSAGFPRDELIDIREQLYNLQNKLDKLRSYEEGLKVFKEHEGVHHSLDEMELETKTKHFREKVMRLDKEIESKVLRRHNEL